MTDPLDEVAAFCAEHHPRLVGLLSMQLGDRDVAEELAQDVLLRLCEHWPSLDNPRAWLNRVAINRANSWLRRRGAERRAKARRRAQQVEVPPAEQADAIAVRAAVAALPGRQRTALLCRYYADMTVAETASVMSCAPGTVKALTHHALSALRDRAGLVPTTEASDAT